jgi:glycosyltransferase involved in cell wall biosynthesis
MISIIIPTLNEEKYLPRLLQSIKQQNFFDYEIIVADGGSHDKTILIAKEFSAKTVVDDSVKHPSAQRNKGAELASGDTLLFLDADSELPTNFLSLASQAYAHQSLKIAGFYIKFNPDKWHYRIYSAISNTILYLKQYTASPAAIGAGLMVSRSIHQQIEGFDLSVVLAEDYDYCARAQKFGKFRIIKSIKLLYSARRIEKEGFWRAGWKWLKMGVYTLSNRRIKKQIVKYDFGKF